MTDSASPPSPSREHEQIAEGLGPLGFAVITFSDTRTEETDSSGRLIREGVARSGHRVARSAIVTDDPDRIRGALEDALGDPDVGVIVTNGGTGVSLRDSAYEQIALILEKRLDGFGEIFRMLSYEEIGPAAMLSRAVAGVARGKVVFSLPGSSNAVRLGLDKLVLPEAAHLYYELHKQAGPGTPR